MFRNTLDKMEGGQKSFELPERGTKKFSILNGGGGGGGGTALERGYGDVRP